MENFKGTVRNLNKKGSGFWLEGNDIQHMKSKWAKYDLPFETISEGVTIEGTYQQRAMPDGTPVNWVNTFKVTSQAPLAPVRSSTPTPSVASEPTTALPSNIALPVNPTLLKDFRIAKQVQAKIMCEFIVTLLQKLEPVPARELILQSAEAMQRYITDDNVSNINEVFAPLLSTGTKATAPAVLNGKANGKRRVKATN